MASNVALPIGRSVRRHPARWLQGVVLVLVVLSLTACGARRTQPALDAAPPESALATATTADAPGETTADTPVATVAPAEDAATMATVPPPDLAERGPAAATAPMDRNEMYDAPPPMEIDPSKYYYATLKTNKGNIEVQLFADRAPKTVNNFVFLARQGFYDDTTFHRVLDGFMAQAGDPTGTGAGGPGYEFEDEIFPGLVFDQSGLLAMANRGPGTNGSQFFITFGPTEWLTGNHTIFGKVIEGEEVLSKITRRDPQTAPDTPGDSLYTVLIEEADTSILPTPTPSPPTPTPTPTPTPFAPSSVDRDTRPLATLTPEERINYFNTAPEMVIDTDQQYTATIATNRGELVVELYDDAAPVAVNNFVVLADLGFYDQMPIALVQPGDSIILGAPDRNPLNDAGYRFPAEIGALSSTDIGGISYIPFEQLADGTILSSSSQLLIALIEPPDPVTAQYPFFGQVVEGVDLLQQLTIDDVIESITISSTGP